MSYYDYWIILLKTKWYRLKKAWAIYQVDNPYLIEFTPAEHKWLRNTLFEKHDAKNGKNCPKPANTDPMHSILEKLDYCPIEDEENDNEA